MEVKRTKIIATIGPSSSSVAMLARMMRAGMNVCRLNFSHGTHEEHKKLIANIRAAEKKVGVRVAILQDLQGPKMRVGDLPAGGIELKTGKRVSFHTGKQTYKIGGSIPVTYASLHKDVKKGHRILLDDGLLELQVTSVRGREISATVKTGGLLRAHKGMNLPDSTVSAPAFTEKDKEDLLFGLAQEIDWVALSFVTSAAIVKKVRNLVATRSKSIGRVAPKLMVKIERKEAIEQFPEILDAADGVMLARGDLGVEIPFEQVPLIQKEFIEICRQAGKPIVVATHMLDSMTHHPRATRAEISDVANAVIDHADAVMLSQESATGEYPHIAVQTMATVLQEAEASRLDDIGFFQLYDTVDLPTSMAQSLHVMAENGHIDAIVSSVEYGEVAQKINVFRPNAPIILACPNETTANQLMVRAGVFGVVMSSDPGSFVHRMERELRDLRFIKTKHRLAYVLAAPNGQIQLLIR